MTEAKEYLTDQLITYLGNKRSLLHFIELAILQIKSELGKKKIDMFDVFSGSGVVARLFKQHSNILYVNDMEYYSYCINKCYLTNKNEFSNKELLNWFNYLNAKLKQKFIDTGFIYELYSPKDDSNIQKNERVFYTSRNAKYIDTAMIHLKDIPEPYKTLLLGPLLFEASTKNNTGGVFKGFYKNSKTNIGQFGGNGKNALNRIMADIQIKLPILSNFSNKYFVHKGDSNLIVKQIPHVDVAYIDPPYNQHPYSSNYFMLNLISTYEKPKEISKVSGIPTNWNKSKFNNKKEALSSLLSLCKSIDASYIIISYNSEGFISYNEMIIELKKMGKVQVMDTNYNVFRASRNLRNRNIHLKEYLFILKKSEIK
jgi:adenine-specific DNA-methyltransferase